MNIRTTKNTPAPKYYLDKPDFSKIDRNKVFEQLEKDPRKYGEIYEKSNEPKYIYWDEFRYKFLDDTLSTEEQWFWVRQLRNVTANEIAIKAEDGKFFKWIRLSSTDEFLHKIDMLAGGQLFPHSDLLSISNRQTFINRGVIEEAIASSQLEGAHTTRKAARKMLIENKKPRNESEQMILNNYKTINAIEKEFKSKPLTKELLFEIHNMLTVGTLKRENQNRFRKDKDNIVVQGQIGTEEYTTHNPPKGTFLNSEVERFISYANDENDEKFTHPIIKAIFLHFWIGYLHPFVDGNGRLARALFYWYLLRKDYWIFMYLPISTVIKEAPVQYAMAYIYVEQDNNDITYFYDFHIRKILQALKEFKEYIEEKIQENKEVTRIISQNLPLNDRQKQLIHYFLSDQDASTSITSHATINSIARQTAARDLKELEASGLITHRREGKFIKFYPDKKLNKLILRS